MGEAFELFALRRIDDSYAIERDIQRLSGGFDGGAVSEQDGGTHSERMKLACRLEHARFGTFREDDPLGVSLKFLDDTGYEPHIRQGWAKSSVKSIEKIRHQRKIIWVAGGGLCGLESFEVRETDQGLGFLVPESEGEAFEAGAKREGWD